MRHWVACLVLLVADANDEDPQITTVENVPSRVAISTEKVRAWRTKEAVPHTPIMQEAFDSERWMEYRLPVPPGAVVGLYLGRGRVAISRTLDEE